MTGSAYITGNSARHAFLWDGNAMQDLGTLGGTESFGGDINDLGQVTGSSDITGNAARHAFLWDGHTMQDLGALGGSGSAGLAINASGLVVGATGDAESRAFVWIEGTLYDLNSLIDPADPLKPHVTLTRAEDINDRGQVLAAGVDSRTSGRRLYVVSPVATDVHLELAALSDVNGNGSADAAVLAGNKVYVKDGATGETISEMTILDANWQTIDLAVTPGGAAASIGILAQDADGSIAVAVYRARDGRRLLEIPFFGPSWLPSALAYVPNADGPEGSAFGVVATNLNDQRVSVQLRRRSDGSVINTSRFYLANWEPIAFDTMGDVSGNDRPELVVLARSELGVNQVLVKDADTAAIVNKINYLGASTIPSALAVLGNMGGGAAPGLTVLGKLPDGRHMAQHRDALTDDRVSNVQFFNSSWTTVDIEALKDVNGNTTADLAVLAQHDTTHVILAQIRDALTGDLIRSVKFLGPSWSARALAAFADIDGNGVQEIGVAARNDDGDVRVQLRDASTGAVVRTMAIP